MRLSSSRSWDLCTLLGTGVLSVLGWLLPVGSTQALPSFSRQTGEACTACHVQTWGADLLPRGREFKLRGYTDGDGSSSWIPPVSATMNGSLSTNVDPGSGHIAPFYGSYKASVFYAGRIVNHLGSYLSASYQNSNDTYEAYYLDKLDLRFASRAQIGGVKINYGITANNQPGLQDLWNTLSPWRFAVASPFPWFAGELDGSRAGNSGGASIYAMVNDWLYVEAGAYASLPRDVQRHIGRSTQVNFQWPIRYFGQPQLDGGAPYWRVAVQHTLGGHYFSVGHFGFVAETSELSYLRYSGYRVLYREDQRSIATDLGIDATYQYVGDPDHIFELKAVYLRDAMRSRYDQVTSTASIPVAGWADNSLIESVRIHAAYTWLQTLGVAFGYSRQTMGDSRSRYFGVARPLPDREGYLAELSFTPFGKSTSVSASLLNLRLNLIYMGDLHGDRNADSMYLNGSLAF